MHRKAHPVLAFLGFMLGAMVALISPEGLDIPQTTGFSWSSPSITQPAEVGSEPQRIGLVSDSIVTERPEEQHQSRHSKQVLALHSRGHDVQSVQQRLRELGFLVGDVSGYFDQSTHDAVKDFQRARGLVADGKVGPGTYSALGLE